jgi:hypothetical protein
MVSSERENNSKSVWAVNCFRFNVLNEIIMQIDTDMEGENEFYKCFSSDFLVSNLSAPLKHELDYGSKNWG